MKRVTTFKNDNYREDLSYRELRDLYDHSPYIEEFYIFKYENKQIYFGTYSRRLYFRGRSHYVKTTCLESFTYKSGKIYGNYIFNEKLVKELGNYIDTRWLTEDQISYKIMQRYKSLFKSLISGSIYNQETLYKAYCKRICGLKCNFSWRLVREFLNFNHLFGPPLLKDIEDFTVDFNNSLRAFMDRPHEFSELQDTLCYAIKEGSRINLNWSSKRLHEEHMEQIRRFNLKEIEKTGNKSIYTQEELDKFNTDTIKILNTERATYLEGLNMHHCIYTCYWNTIKNKAYFGFHMTYPEECTFGVLPNGILNQIFLAYDKPVKSETKVAALDYIKEHKDLFNRENLIDQPLPF